MQLLRIQVQLFQQSVSHLLGQTVIRCEWFFDNEYDKHAIATIYDILHSNKVVGHVTLGWIG